MSDRRGALRRHAADILADEAVADAFLAKAFTDRLLVLDVTGETVPEPIEDRLAARDLYPGESVYEESSGDAAPAGSAVGSVGEATRHHFVDVRTRGDHQADVVD